MHFPIPLLFLLLSISFTTSLPLPTAALKPRNNATITIINTIIDDLSVLQAKVAAFTGTPEGAQSIGTAAGKLDNDLDLATEEIGISTYSVSESAELRVLVVPLGTTHTNGLAALSAKAPMFAALGVTTQVKGQLLQLSLDNDDLWTALVEKLAPGDQDAVEAVGNQTRVAYQNALAVF